MDNTEEGARRWAVDTVLKHYGVPIGDVVLAHMFQLADCLASYSICGKVYGREPSGVGMIGDMLPMRED